MSLPSYAVYWRGRPACPCQVTWLPAFEHEAQRRGLLRGPLPVSQLIGGAAASGNTHVDGGAADFYPLTVITDVDAFVELAREMGADATWERPPNWDGRNGVRHVHSVLTDCPHNEPARYQIDAVRDDQNGLANHGPDTGPRPLSGRTWRQGIEWAQQQEDDMFSDDDSKRLKQVEKKLDRVEEKLDRFRTNDTERDNRSRALLAQLAELEKTGATAAQVRGLRVDVQALAAAVDDEA